jgi:riboflavin synthase
MFTGIVREVGTVARFDGSRLVVEAGTEAELGDSVAIAGVCLTVAARENGGLAFDVVSETLGRTTLGSLSAGDKVNVEPSLRAGDPLGGHIVQGHVDGTGEILSRSPAEHWEVVRIGLPVELARYVVEKGSITVDGISLTVSGLGDDWFEVSLIPTTRELTTLGPAVPGTRVNLEVDVIAKYVERLMAAK